MRTLLSSVWLLVISGTLTRQITPQPVPVGWHDELNDLSGWQPRDGGMKCDVFAERRGAMTLRLPHVPEGFPHAYQWGGVTQEASVDLGRYPVVVAHVRAVAKDSYTHLDLEERDFKGNPVRTLRTPTLLQSGLTILDVGKEWEVSDTRRLHLRINVGGALSGCASEYAWVRFVSREDAEFLKKHPGTQNVVLKE